MRCRPILQAAISTSAPAHGRWSVSKASSRCLGAEALAARISNERTGDGRYRPLTNVIGLWLLEQTLKEFAARPRDDAEWSKLIKAAEKLPAPAVLLDVADPAFGNPTSMRAAIDAQLKKKKVSATEKPRWLHPADLRITRPWSRRSHAHVRTARRKNLQTHPHRGRRLEKPAALSGDGGRGGFAGRVVFAGRHSRREYREPAHRVARSERSRDVSPTPRPAKSSKACISQR